MQISTPEAEPLITNTAVVLGLLMTILGLVFYSSNLSNKYIKGFYNIIPPLLLCYFLPGLLNSFNVFDGENSPLTSIGSRYFLPACLILFIINLDLKEMWALRKRAGLMFITGTVGIVLGGPLAVFLTSLVAPQVVGGAGPDEVWRGLGALAGSWIGGSANQVALKEILKPSPNLFSSIIAVDVFVAYIWMAFLLYGAGKVAKFNAFFKADDDDVEQLKERMDAKSKANSKIPDTKDLILMIAIAFGGTGLATFISEPLAAFMKTNYPQLESFSLTSDFFWIILFATIIGIAISFTPAKKLEYAGASKVGSVFLYVLITTIGMQMDILAILSNPGLFVVGMIWMSFHALLLLIVGKIFKVPFFYFAVGSMANVGGVASASVTSAAFHPSLISVGVILAVFGYAIGTYAGWLTAVLMQLVSPI
ncbi:DUF819 family protein [Sphingobacterium sp. DK4209]|uniref:DUF819 family protein n=1 Tax=Sphingobacterium zhuxiongii TaxID=2662364 RepID=A0A5Q0QCQ8_9SPHI|nr:MULTISPECIES: DUF819 family protein [unclassified Sphingobacterium]MVZ66429.1 DUF819 family protein [Sphingobacterium sp. DK4209]QGA27276.1 DUF819 family protein [Sphingobacterium sp. dk4302]